MFFFFGFDEEGKENKENCYGIYKVSSLHEYAKGRDNLKKLQDLYEEMGQRKEQEDLESEAVAESIREQNHQLALFADRLENFDSRYFSGNLEFLMHRDRTRMSDLESLLGVSAGYVSRTMGADSKKRLSVDIAWKIAKIFQVNMDDLLNRDLTAPTKDLKTAVDFVDKLRQDTDNEAVHWKNEGIKPCDGNAILFMKEQDGQKVFSPKGEYDDFYEAKEIYSVTLTIGQVYLVQTETMLNETVFDLYLYDDDAYGEAVRYGVEPENPLVFLCGSEMDRSDLLLAECTKLMNAIKTHADDFIVSEEAKNYINRFLNPIVLVPDDDDDLPFK